MTTVFQLIILLFSAIIHEVAHGFAAFKLGDDTAEKMGRLTLNPLPHLDFLGSFAFPLISFLSTGGSLVFGWAKPVPYNPFKLKNLRRDTALLAFAGPLANLSMALIFSLFIRFTINNPQFSGILLFLAIIVKINLILAVFNLIPIPPFDGSKIFFYLFPSRKLESFLYQYSFLFIFLILFFGGGIISLIVNFLFSVFTGII
ncbi:MAG: site-2 protease family protein [Candidatus Pacebacteria bacterium]|nr:site-2 protease family protein [Candidatus Paceibacterota bacterium]MDD3548443.1 site-2 protease family protein [Candidatus Paceibacterota bacterium]MDD4999288.1 site-2 protease family protein [Candidatus Paceibacterota bacterium]MDD5545381.1 site-2 protease family protein [Candidatus Paceibacterota bacterium]